uniref:Uncharacterized protein n=1 Tax=viral metagenome TaxID=1070528 RepID=A0A6C0AUF6_9ZZZZ
MATVCLNHLNYIAIIILYCVCFYFINQPYTEIVGFSILFVVNTAFMLFFGSQYQTFHFDNNKLFYEGQIAFFSVIIGLVFHFVSLILMIMMISTLQIKYTKTEGTPIKLTGQYRDQMETFKSNMIAIFVMIFVILIWFFFGYNINISHPILQKIVPGIIIILSLIVIAISSWQVSISNAFSLLQYRQLTAG